MYVYIYIYIYILILLKDMPYLLLTKLLFNFSNFFVQNTNILYYEPDFNRLQIMEAILIQELTPTINNQNTGVQRTLKLT